MSARWSALLVLACACEAPPVFPTADVRQNADAGTGRIEGQVVVSGVGRGDAVLFLFDAARPPPPAGTGSPLTFTTVPRAQLFGAAGPSSNGPFTAPFAFSLVKPGAYLIRGLIDTNADFIPWFKVTADANAGDVGGAAVDPITRAPQVITAAPTALDVSVSFSDAATVSVDRPVFQVVTPLPSATVMAGMPPVTLDLVPQPINQGAVREPRPVFLAQLIDDDHDGIPDDKNRDGVPDLWPKVVVRKIAAGDNLLLDDDGDFTHVVNMAPVDPDGVPDVVVLAAGIDPTDLLPMLLDGDGKPRTSPVSVSRLKLVIRPLALDAANPLAPVPLISMPPGRYAIVLISVTGQTWRVPNELATGLGSRLGLPEVASQGFVIQVP
ncbi:MAG: hypothetical protein IPJ65_35845 [Archangiaceae bacterium]|nr:hypothetical protein [Archangiaceae bacterium]